MATVRLRDMRTGNTADYPLAYFDWDAWQDYINDNLSYTGTETTGSIITANTGLPAAVLGSETSFYLCNVPEAYRFLIDTVKIGNSKNLLYINPETKWSDLFAPTLDSSPTTYGTPPAGYNTFGDYYRDSTAIDGVSTVSKAPAAFDITKTWYSSSHATAVYKTYNGMTFGMSAYVGNGYMLNLSALVGVGWKQYDRGETPAWNNRNNIEWAPSMSGGIILGNDAGDYRSTSASYEIPDYPAAAAPTEWITTQCIYTIRNGQHLCGVAAILWESDGFGDYRPKEFNINFLPLWAWGQISGEFIPDTPDIDEIPVQTPDTGLGSYKIGESPAGVATPPAVSPIATVDTTDGGIHVFVCDSAAIDEIEDQLWDMSMDNSAAGIQSAMSGIIACGFMPDDLIGVNWADPTYKRTQIELGGFPIDLTNGNAYLINHRIFTHVDFVTFGSGDGEPLSEVYHDYHDYEPFTSVKIIVPFCGEISIPASSCIGGSVTVSFSCNLTTGDICATITAVSSDRVRSGTLVTGSLTTNYYLQGNAFSRFPIMGSSNGMSQYIAGAAQSVAGIAAIASGGVAGAVAGAAQLIGGINGMHNADKQPVQGAAPIGSPAIVANKRVIIEVTRPSPYVDGAYKAMLPPAAEYVATIGSAQLPAHDPALVDDKYTPISCTEVYFEDTDNLSRAELDEIERLLKGGILL